MRILVVDDKELHRKAAETTLSGHEVTIVKSFDEAMEVIERKIDEEKAQRLLVEAGFPSVPSSKEKERWDAYWKAYEIAQANSVIPLPYEMVLTDMMMPMSKKNLNSKVFNPNELVPYGFVIALKAALLGAKYVAVVTDTNHHDDAISAAIDHLDRNYCGNWLNFVVNGAKMMFVHSGFVGVPGTICHICEGTKKQDERECFSCKGDGTNHRGKDWGRVFSDLTK